MQELIEMNELEEEFYRTLKNIKMLLVVNNIEPAFKLLFTEEVRLRNYVKVEADAFFEYLEQLRFMMQNDEVNQAIKLINIKLRNLGEK